MPVKRVRAIVDGRAIVAENTWFSGARLLVDGEVMSSSQQLFSVTDTDPILVAFVEGQSGRPLHIEVFIVAWVTTRIMICVNGTRVSGARLQRHEEAAARRAQNALLEEGSVGVGGAAVAIPLLERDRNRR